MRIEISMDQDKKKRLRTTIQEKIEAVEADIVSFKRLTEPIAPDNAIGRLTRMEAIGSKSINEAALRKAKTRRSQLERALVKIDDPDFGLCRECEEPIPYSRLMVLPETDLCIECAENLVR